MLRTLAMTLALSATTVHSQPEEDRAPLRAFLEATITDAISFEDRFDAEVWLVDMQARLAPFIDNPAERLDLLRRVHATAAAAELSPELVLAVIEVESGFDRYAVSRVGAQGLMQVMPFWKAEIGRTSDNLTAVQTNLTYGCRILQYYLQREQDDLHRALAAYNGSSGSRVYSDRVFKAWNRRWRTAPLAW